MKITDINEARQKVVAAGKHLQESGLIARTWGNVSCRLNDSQFVITPSGLAYEKLTPAEIVAVNIEDESYEGDLAPSSEKGVHAVIYRQRKDVNFIIHTHQLYASALSGLGLSFAVEDPANRKILGDMVSYIPYGLPGTKKLRNEVADVLAGSNSKAFIMASHGVICIGADSEEVFQVAAELEGFCKNQIIRRYLEQSGRSSYIETEFYRYYLENLIGPGQIGALPEPAELFSSERKGDRFLIYPEAAPKSGHENKALTYSLDRDNNEAENGASAWAASVHRAIYRQRSDIKAIKQSLYPPTLTVSRTGQTIYPMVDDFAQIIGISALPVELHPGGRPEKAAALILRWLKGRNAVMLKNSGALCCASNLSDAGAMAMIMEKNCLAYITGALFGAIKPLHPLECRLMRYIYLKRYAKKGAS